MDSVGLKPKDPQVMMAERFYLLLSHYERIQKSPNREGVCPENTSMRSKTKIAGVTKSHQ